MPSTPAPVNPSYAARLARRAPARRAEEPKPIYAKLPRAPMNGSPVPHLTSLYHNEEAGPYGDRRYPGNCSGNLIRDLLRFFQPCTVLDPMTGSGTCRDVCRELGIAYAAGDLRYGQDAQNPDAYPAGVFEFCWIHPPYWRQKRYGNGPHDLSSAPTLQLFLEGYERVLRNCALWLKPGGKLAVLMGDYIDHEAGFVPLVFYTKLLCFRAGLRQCATDIIRFLHGVGSSKKVYHGAFIPGLHDVATIFEKIN